MGIVDKVRKVIDWKPPSSKQSGIINADTLYSDQTINYVEMYYNDNKIYTNVWYKWSGTSKKSGETIEAKGYAWFRWENGKAVEAYNAFDPTAYNAAMSLE